MKDYIQVSFWIGVFALGIRLCQLAWSEYPRDVRHSRGDDVLSFVISGGFMVWAAWLLWAH